ncbi:MULTISPECIES: hypothetical protein [Streptomyces]|uniref:hypothetical protein n=1 Tax=Streptomyces TaxID=1883 RepID=UPI0004CCD6F9|nr:MULTISPECIES: hypothetical protein [Streptomyces]KOT62987.1 hypothetical protein ADK43_09510 [Streptomyces rimosus subsp. rimosus]
MSAPSEEETPRKKKRRLLAVPLLVAALAAGGTVLVLQTGSSSAAPAASSAKIGAAAATSSASASSGTGGSGEDTSTREQQAEAFTQCMRDNGVKDFPGITIKENGQLQLKGGSNVNPVSKAYRAAAKTCASKLPEGSKSLPKEPTAVTPETPSLGFTCTEDCPSTPKAPSLPSDF